MAVNPILETGQLVADIIPVDTQTGANAGDWVSMKWYQRCLCVLYKAAGVAGDDPVFKLQQATVVAGSDAKDLLFTEIYSKVGTQSTTGTFTKVTQAAATSYTDTVSAEAQAIIAVDVRWDMLDIDNGFCCINLSIADTGSAGAQLGCAFYLLYGAREAKATTASAIID